MLSVKTAFVVCGMNILKIHINLRLIMVIVNLLQRHVLVGRILKPCALLPQK